MASESGGFDVLHHLQDPPWISLPTFRILGIDFDMTVTRSVVMMWISALLCFVIFRAISREKSHIPSKLRSFFEAILLFLRDEVARPCMGPNGDKYIPFLWTTFFFILFSNYLGLIPGGANATGTISITVVLALISFAVTEYAGLRAHGAAGYAKHFLLPVPFVMHILMVPLEILSHITRTLALAIRLFANMMAGHLVISVILYFITLFGSIWYLVAPGSVGAAIAISLLEILFGLIQAFVFMLLTATFIGMVIADEHAEEH